MTDETIAVIEDEPDIREVIEFNLTRDGYQVICAADGESGLEKVRKHLPSLVLLDLMLPGLDGLEVCRRLKKDPSTRPIPIIMVTAKGEENDIVRGLQSGADDYIAKPFSPKELAARVEAVLRRGPLREDRHPGERVVRGGLVLDSARHEVLVDGEEVRFTATEFRLLYYLASRPGRVFSRDQLLTQAGGEPDICVLDRNVDVHIRSIRKKIGNYRDLVETIRGVGYRFRPAEMR